MTGVHRKTLRRRAADGNRYQSRLFKPDFMPVKNLPVPESLKTHSKIDVPFE
jgi:hypothetical protein